MYRQQTIPVLLASLLLGCADMKYPGWQKVAFIDSAYDKPCEYRAEEEVATDYESAEDEISDLQKNAISSGGNTIVRRGVKSREPGLVSYFYCAPGLKPFKGQPNEVWLAKNIHNKNVNKMDLDKAVAKCTYEVHRATLDTTRPAQARAFVSNQYYETSDPATNLNNATINLSNTISQMSAARKDKINEENWKARMTQEKKTLLDECLKADGFVTTYSMDPKDVATLIAKCPNQDNGSTPCLVNGN
jgi:hypothetical protein